MICQDTPYLSCSQPHCFFPPPSDSFSHSSSISAWVSHRTNREIAGENVKCGPPLKAMNSRPSISNVTEMTAPSGHGPPPPVRMGLTIFAFLKTDT